MPNVQGTWTGSPTFAYDWLRCDRDGGSCSTISGANDETYVLESVDDANTLRARVTAKNADGSNAATTVPTAVVTPAAAPPTTSCTPGSGSVPVANLSLPTRLVLDRFAATITMRKLKGFPTAKSQRLGGISIRRLVSTRVNISL